MKLFRAIKLYMTLTCKDRRGRTLAQNLAWFAGGGSLSHWKACKYLAGRD